MASKKKLRKKKQKTKKVKNRNPYALGLALRNGAGFHSNKKYNRNLEKRKQRKESEEE